jgi:hypothetical protein
VLAPAAVIATQSALLVVRLDGIAVLSWHALSCHLSICLMLDGPLHRLVVFIPAFATLIAAVVALTVVAQQFSMGHTRRYLHRAVLVVMIPVGFCVNAFLHAYRLVCRVFFFVSALRSYGCGDRRDLWVGHGRRHSLRSGYRWVRCCCYLSVLRPKSVLRT